LIHQVFQEGIMDKSNIYQEILQEGEVKLMTKDTAEDNLEGEQAVILRQLDRRIGNVSTDLQSQIRSLSLYQLEALAEALLDFSQPADLLYWLDINQD
jgi:predicted transposase YdaD